MSEQRTLCDTNILVRMTDPEHPDHVDVKDEISQLHARGIDLVIVPQTCYEYYVVATRPTEQRGLGLSPDKADSNINDLLGLFHLLLDDPELLATWRALVKQYAVRGKQAHDARLVAAMRHHQISRIMTCNAKDFRRYEGLNIIEPCLAA